MAQLEPVHTVSRASRYCNGGRENFNGHCFSAIYFSKYLTDSTTKSTPTKGVEVVLSKRCLLYALVGVYLFGIRNLLPLCSELPQHDE